MSEKVSCSMFSVSISIRRPKTFYEHVKFSHGESAGCDGVYHLFASFKRHWNKCHPETKTVRQNAAAVQTINDKASDPASIEDVVVASSNTTDDVRAGLKQSSAEDRHDFDHELQPQHSGQQNLVPVHREIESLLFTPGAAFSEFEWEAGLLLATKIFPDLRGPALCV
ncbi:hypothetical protein OUZ56_021872 [Daphnia magna]|uniref:C2H2-type domain-containing protein n=1 Tax=Daphnia magna TaxID=35525 RepID=A0ABR0AUR7_9CRUS|nr:hypothetical protein OUZ56_021872 [Daphnia magna]